MDVPWRPADLEQREGRIIRQGNQNPEVDIINYVTEGAFDTVMLLRVTDLAHGGATVVEAGSGVI
ncbi:hypothetical protein ACOJVU_05475 [Mycobacterium sp. THU-M104]|uniref:hypothetical protein n=1 Tax=Mycobacterium sp. THU-M104 TaxID=3410515 RepID=UPI003B9B6D8E